MLSINDNGTKPIEPTLGTSKIRSERAELIENIYSSYVKSYVPTPKYKKPLPVRVIAIKLAHIPTKDLYYLRSCCLDRLMRNESVGKYLLGSIKAKPL